MKRTLCILITIVALPVFGQMWTPDEENARNGIGLKMGVSVGSMYGKELKNPRPLIGFMAGLFIKGKDTNRLLNWQTGLEARLRGSNFANGALGNTAYTRIGLITLDAPLLLNINTRRLGKMFGRPVNPQSLGKEYCIQLGIINSYILRSILYQGDDHIPANREEYKKTWSKLPFSRFDYQAMIGFQKRGPRAGWQLALKVGINNLNAAKKFNMPPDLSKPTDGISLPGPGTGRYIGTWSLEFGILF